MNSTTITHFLSTHGSVGITSNENVVSLSKFHEFGRFAVHFTNRSAPDLSVINLINSPGEIRSPNSDPIKVLDISLWIAPSDGATQIVITTSPEKVDADALASDLGQICFNRNQLIFNNERLMDFCRKRLEELGFGGNLQLGPDVHQFVLLKDSDADLFAAQWPKRSSEDMPPEVIAVVYRESTNVARTSKQVGLKVPLELNRRSSEIGAHGRGVTLLGGHDLAVVNTMMYTASKLLFGLGRLRNTRRELLALLQTFTTSATPEDLKEAYDRAALRSEIVRRHGLRVSTEIEAYIDGMSIPEMVVDSYRRSLIAALDLEQYLSVTHRLLDRVSLVVESQREDLYLNLRAVETINQTRWSSVIATASAFTLPLALLFSYFSISDSKLLTQPLPWIVAILFASTLLVISWRVKVRNAKQFKRSLKGLR